MKTIGLLMLLTLAPALDAAERKVTLDVKDADVRDVLQTMKQQCGIRNMVIDPEVKGRGARLIFRDVPCSTAFRIVLRQFRLTGQFDGVMTTVETPKR